MNELGRYLIESGLSLCVFYVIYRTFLRRDTFFSRNRIYLTITIGLSMIIPLLELSVRQPSAIYSFEAIFEEVVIIPATQELTDPSGFSPNKILRWIYFSGVIFFFLKFLFHMGQIYWLIRTNGITRENGLRIVYLDRNISPFSFHNIIFLDISHAHHDNKEKIIAHEKNHIDNKHTMDLLLFEILTVVQWFNPVAWLYKWSLKEVHEFQADSFVLREGYSSLTYQELIISQVFGNQFFRLVHHLNNSLIKRRMLMMMRFKSSRKAFLKVLLVLPATLLLLALFAFSENRIEPLSGEEEMPIPAPASILQDTTIYFITDTLPKFQGKDMEAFREYLSNSLIYPEEAARNGIEGKVYVQFVIDEKGNIRDTKVIRGAHSLLDNEALRVVESSPEWKPGILNGKPVKVQLVFPVVFKLTGKADETQPGPKTDPENPDIYFIVDEMPKFQGEDCGMFRKYIADNLLYPEEAAKNGISGKVYVQFVVNREGYLENVHMVRGVDPMLDREAIRVVSGSPQWEPGKDEGMNVKVAFTFPINFVLDKKKEEDLPEKMAADLEGEVFYIVEQMPRFRGSENMDAFRQYIAENLVYPEEAARKGIEGKVFVQFFIDKNGKMDHINVVRGVHPLLDKEAVRVLSNSPDWEPGKQRGKNVNVAYTFPIVFKLPDNPSDNVQDETVVVGFKSEVSDDVLYLIDGKIVSHDIFKTLNPDHIESIEVLKGEKAEKEFGAAAKEGVVKITMK